MVDADDPMQEIRGEFFWREDHERLLAEARALAFEEGYADGLRRADIERKHPLVLRLRRRRSPLQSAVWFLLLMAVVAYVISLVQA
jgi:hypothetical protein